MARQKIINDIVNQVAGEIGLPQVADIFATADQSYKQLVVIAQACGNELLEEVEWDTLNKELTITTAPGDTGKYDLPDNFGYMIDQTGWNRTDQVPMFGPLSGQVWQYLIGRGLVSYTIYASFRMNDGQIWIFPQPPPEGIEITFEYISNDWVKSLTDGGAVVYNDTLQKSADVPLYDPYLFERLLRLRFREAKGFDTTTALAAYNKSLNAWKGNTKAAPVLSQASGHRCGVPLINNWNNLPDTGYGIE